MPQEENETYLVTLLDGGIKTIHTDKESYGGCHTCDYGSEYINQIDMQLRTGKFTIKAGEMYRYPLSEGYMMETMLGNIEIIKTLTEEAFMEWIEEKITTDISGVNVETEFQTTG